MSKGKLTAQAMNEVEVSIDLKGEDVSVEV